MTRFRPCIDLHAGQVKQIVGGTLRDDGPGPAENYVSEMPSAFFADMYRQYELTGGHVIQLGPGNKQAAEDALSKWPGGLQLGGGINLENAVQWLHAGASHVIVTSWLFDDAGHFMMDRLKQLAAEVGADHLVVDLSCRKTASGWTVAMNRWQKLTNLDVTHATLDMLAEYCAEYLIHAADVEGLCQGVDADLARHMGDWGKIPMTYAGGVATLDDCELIDQASGGKIDVTVGSALDIFGGMGVKFTDMLKWNDRGSY